MANINVSDLHPAGSDLFSDSENFLTDLTDYEFTKINGGSIASLIAYLIDRYLQSR
jgi:hypothetical protein